MLTWLSSFVGGVTVLLQTRQDWTYKVETFVTCARLRRHDINDIIERYPTFKKKVMPSNLHQASRRFEGYSFGHLVVLGRLSATFEI